MASKNLILSFAVIALVAVMASGSEYYRDCNGYLRQVQGQEIIYNPSAPFVTDCGCGAPLIIGYPAEPSSQIVEIGRCSRCGGGGDYFGTYKV